jgi:hypothetical protein
MSELVIPPGFGLWTFYLQHAGISHTALVTLGFSVAAPPYTQANNDAAHTAWVLAMQPLWDAEVTFTKTAALIGNDGPLFRFETTGSGTGSRTAQTVTPPQTTYLLTKATGLAGRRYRGRMYLPFVSETGTQQTGQLESAESTILAARATALETGLVGGTTGSGGLFLLHSESPLSATPDPTLITNLSAGAFVATQRRRLRRS